jgi:hypothetical protein
MSSQSVRVFTNRCLVAASNVERSPSSGFPKCPRPQLPASNSNGSQQLNRSSRLTHSVTNQLILVITFWHGPHRKHISSVAVYRPLPSNGRCIVAYIAVVA